MLLVFRSFRKSLTKTALIQDFVNKSDQYDILTYLKNLTACCINRTKNPSIFNPIKSSLISSKFLETCSCYRVKITFEFFDVAKFTQNDTKIDETSVKSMGKTTRRRRRTNLCRKIVKIVKKKKRNKRKKVMSHVWLNYNAVAQQLSCSDTAAKSYSDVAKTRLLHSKGTNIKQFLTEVRHDVYTPYGKWIKEGWLDERAKNGIFFKVVSYNILAQNLLEMHPELYIKHDKQHLEWNHRKEVLMSELKNFDADILCLQEVQLEKLDYFNTELQKLGYRGLFKKRTHDKDDGCAIYYRDDKFNLVEHSAVEFFQPNIHLLNRDNIAILARLSPKNCSDKSIVVANTHLLFNPNRHDIKLCQMQILLAEIDRIAYRSYHENGDTPYYPVILAGDFNVKPFTFVHKLLTNGYIDNVTNSRSSRYVNNYNPNQLIPPRLGITDGCQHYDVVMHRRDIRTELNDFKHVRLENSEREKISPDEEIPPWRRTRLNYELFGSGSLYHNLNLASVYPHSEEGPWNVSANQDDWCNVDYIFYGPCKKENGQRVDGEMKLVSYVKLPNTSEANILQCIPNEVCGSDHLPLISTFHLPVEV